MNKTIKDIVELYISEPLKRTRSKIYDNTSFIENLKERTKDPNCEKVDKEIAIKFMALLAEEELRRYQIKLDEDSDFELYMAKVLRVDLHKYVVDYVDNLSEKMLDKDVVDIKNYFENKIKLILKISTDDVSYYEHDQKDISQEAKKLFVVYKLVFHKHILPLLKFASFITDEKLDFTGLESFGIDSYLKMMALIVQNRINRSDKKMIKSIKDTEYCDFINESEDYLKDVIEKIIKTRREFMIDKITDEESNYELKDILKLFKETENMNVAAGILKGLSEGTKLFDGIVKLLQDEKCAYPRQKINMLRKGTYLDIVLVCDNQGYIVEWKPQKKVMAKLIENNMNNIIRSEWIKMFPDQISHISNTYHKINSSKVVFHTHTTEHSAEQNSVPLKNESMTASSAQTYKAFAS